MDTVGHAASNWLEPFTALGALAMTTSRIGLIATASTTYAEPFNLARQFASLDHISNGRIGWNIVTSWLAAAARNYGGTGLVSHEERYKRGEEFVQVAKALWARFIDLRFIEKISSQWRPCAGTARRFRATSRLAGGSHRARTAAGS